MKKLLLFAVLISAVTLVGFWGGRKACTALMWPSSLNASQSWLSGLGVSPSQEKTLKEMDASFRRQSDRACIEICRERMELLNRMNDPEASSENILAKVEAIGSQQTAMEKMLVAHMLEVRKHLTPEQSKVYLERVRREFQKSIAPCRMDVS
jgi:Spy/CpxP family protein refolding chaperone